MAKRKTRFVDVKRLIELQKWKNEIEDEYDELNHTEMHCRVCGDTKPKFGFVAIFSSIVSFPVNGKRTNNYIQTSSVICNKCGNTDENYLKWFGEPKSADQ